MENAVTPKEIKPGKFKPNGQFAKGTGNFADKKKPDEVVRIRSLIRAKLTDKVFNQLIEVMLNQAAQGNVKAAQFLMDYNIGKPTQTINSTVTNISPEEQVKRLDDLLGYKPNNGE